MKDYGVRKTTDRLGLEFHSLAIMRHLMTIKEPKNSLGLLNNQKKLWSEISSFFSPVDTKHYPIRYFHNDCT